jgi:hypothetical protein
MICRLWHGWTTPANADAYEQLLREEVFVGIASRGILRRFDAESVIARDEQGTIK